MEKDLSALTERAKTASLFLKALSHETRLLAICHINSGECSVQELESFLGTTQSNISQHLAKLRDRGILDCTKRGNQVFYFVKDPNILNLVKVLQDTFCE